MVVVLYHMLFDKRNRKEVGDALNAKYQKLEQHNLKKLSKSIDFESFSVF